MAPLFEELDYQPTPLGDLVLRRRRSPSVADAWVYEVTLAGEMLMSSTVNASERALAQLALEALGDRPVEVLVGGLGLGYTAGAALEHANVQRLVVVELLAPVIDWHRRRLVPLAEKLIDDPRCSLVEGDFFEHVGPGSSAGPYDAILLDIDHAPDCWLHDRHGDFYTADRLAALAAHLRPGGVFGLWSAWAPPPEFLATLAEAFPRVQPHEVPFFNPHVNEMDANWVILADSPQ